MVTKNPNNPITKIVYKTVSRNTIKAKPVKKQVTKKTPPITLKKTLSKKPIKMNKNKNNVNLTNKSKSTAPVKKATTTNIQKSIPSPKRTPAIQSTKNRKPLKILENKTKFTESYQPKPVIVQPNNRIRFLLTPLTLNRENNKLVSEMKKYPEPIRESKPMKSKEVSKKPSTMVKKMVPPAKVGKSKVVKPIPKPLPTPAAVELPITYSQNTTFIAKLIKLCEEHNVENNDIKLWEEIFENLKLVDDSHAEILNDFLMDPEIALAKINKITAVPLKLFLQELLNLNKYDRIMLQAKYTNKYLTWEDLNNFIINNGDDPIQFILNQFLINSK